MHPMLFSRLSAGANRPPASGGTVVVPDPDPDPDPGEGGGTYGPPNTATLTIPTGSWPTIPLGFASPEAELAWLITNGWPIIEGLGFHTPRTLVNSPSNPSGLVPALGSLPVSAKTSWSSADNGTTWNDTQFGSTASGAHFSITGNNITFNRCVFRVARGTAVNASGVGIQVGLNMGYVAGQGQNITFNNCMFWAENGPATGHKGYQSVVQGGLHTLNECVVLCFNGDGHKIANGSTIRNSYVHSMRDPNSDKHNDSIQGEDRDNWTIEGTTCVSLNWSGGGGGNGVQMITSNGLLSNGKSGVCNDNLFLGGTRALKIGGTVELKGNVFGPDSWTQYGSNYISGSAGTLTLIRDATRPNKNAETGALI